MGPILDAPSRSARSRQEIDNRLHGEHRSQKNGAPSNSGRERCFSLPSAAARTSDRLHTWSDSSMSGQIWSMLDKCVRLRADVGKCRARLGQIRRCRAKFGQCQRSAFDFGSNVADARTKLAEVGRSRCKIGRARAKLGRMRHRLGRTWSNSTQVSSTAAHAWPIPSQSWSMSVKAAHKDSTACGPNLG